MVRIRLQRRGRRKKPFYHIVIADARSPRDGRFIEKVGTYNPMTTPATIDIDRDAAYEWLLKGAQPTDTVRAILRAKGVMYRKHLQRGVDKGALTQEQADAKLGEWIDKKEAGFTERFAETDRKAEQERRRVAGKVPEIPTAEQFYVTPTDTPAPAPKSESAPAAAPAPAEDTPVVAEAPAAEAPVAEAPAPETAATEAPTTDTSAPAAEQLEDAASPKAENADGAVNKAEPDLQSAVDTAQNNAEPAPQPAEVDVKQEAATADDMVAVPEATVTTDESPASTEEQVREDGKTDVPA